MTNTYDQSLTDILNAQMPLSQHLGLKGVEASTESVAIGGNWKAEHCGIGGVLHGGYLMALADAAGATLAFLNLPDGATTTTVESKTNFFRPVTGGSVKATSTLVHSGRATIVAQTDVTDDSGALVSRTLQTQIVRAG